MRVQPKAAVLGGRDFQFLVGVLQRVDALAQGGVRVHGPAYRRAGAVGADQNREVHVTALAVVIVDHAQATAIKVDFIDTVMKMDACAGRLGGIEQDMVEPAAMHRVDHFVVVAAVTLQLHAAIRSEEHTSELQSLMRISYAVFCLKKKNEITQLIE